MCDYRAILEEAISENPNNDKWDNSAYGGIKLVSNTAVGKVGQTFIRKVCEASGIDCVPALTKDGNEAYTSPFFDEEYTATYFPAANDLLTQSQDELEIGKEANANGDAFGLVTVIYSVVLFLLGIAGSFKSLKNKYAIVGVSFVAFAIATIYMLTIPMPLGFSVASFFGG